MRSNVSSQSPAAETVLVIDDEAPARELVQRWLAGAGYRCLTESDAQRGLSLLGREPCEAVVLDIAMPGETGLSVLPRLRHAAPDAAIVMLSGLDDAPTAIEALTGGACGYLIKPAQRDALLQVIGQNLQRRRAIMEKRRRVTRLEGLVQQQTAIMNSAQEEAIHRLITASMFRDEETGAHLKRTGLYCQALATALGWPAAEVELLRLAAPLHDIGKIAIPDAILRKADCLTVDEFAVMKSHAAIGSEMLADSQWPVLQMAEQIAAFHHEWWNGHGYPYGLRGKAIPECARIVSIVDVYDALTHDRVYRPAMEESDALRLMEQGNGTQFDPRIYERFCELLPAMRLIGADHPDAPPLTAFAPERAPGAGDCREAFA